MDSAYSVIVRSRPERTAFIFDASDAERDPARFRAIFDEVIAVCHRRWAGRKSPMAFFQNGAFTEEEWANLELADADRIVSFSKLPLDLVADIDRRLNPEELRVIESFAKVEPRIDIGMHGHGVEVSSVQALLKQFPADYFLTFQFGTKCPPEVRQFCAMNFGRDDAWSPTVFPTATPYEFSALPDVQKLTYGMDHAAHAAEFLTSLVRERGRLMRVSAACQVGSVVEQIPVPLGGLDKAFQIIIGDSPSDLLEHWEGGRWKHNTYRPYARQLWLPSALVRDSAVMQAAIQYAWACNTDAWLGEPRQRIELVSWSWSESDLKALIPLRPSDAVGGEIVPVLPPELLARRKAHVSERLAFPRSLLQYDNSTLRFAGVRKTDHLELPAPDIMRMIRTRSGSGSWSVDVLIEQPQVGDSNAGGERWWLLPRKSCGKLARAIFDRPARINREGYCSLSLRYESTAERRNVLKIDRPDPQSLFSYLFWPRASHEWGSPYDERAKLVPAQPYVRYLGPSDKGDYLSGLITLFGELDAAREFTGRKFWRDTFERLASRDRKKDPRLTGDIAQVIKKVLPTEKPRDELVASAAERIVGLVSQRIAPKPLGRSELEERYASYAQASGADRIGPQAPATSVEEKRQRPLSHEGMQRQLSWLVHRDIFRLGLELQCSRCGVRSWLHIDQAKQHLSCSGCGHEQSLAGEPEWHYELNSLALRCVTSNQLAALQALCHLAYQASHSFVYSTSVEIFRGEEQKPWHEIDLICLCDGRLIVAEVKDTAIVEGDVHELADIAEALNADQALLFLPAPLVSPKHQKWKADILERVARHHIGFDYVALQQA